VKTNEIKRRWFWYVRIALRIIFGVPLAAGGMLLVWSYFVDRTNGSIVSSGLTRRYELYIPRTYDRSKPTPLVISIHPAATWPRLQMNMTRWNELADEHGFIVVYPAGTGVFLGGVGPGPQVRQGGRVYDRNVRFITDLIERLQDQYNIEPNRIYVNGMSNGGSMALALGCAIPDRIAAVAAVAPAGPIPPGVEECTGSKPVPTMIFHGTADRMAPYLGGVSPILPRPLPNMPDWVAQNARYNRCKRESSQTQFAPGVRRIVYSDCDNDADVVFYTIEGGGHTWPGGEHLAAWIAGKTSDEINASRLMWDFFEQHPRGVKP